MIKPLKLILFVGPAILFFLAFSIYSQHRLPAPGGPYAVGRTLWNWVDASRPEVLTEDPEDAREVSAMIWYPAEPETGMSAGYFPRLSSVLDALVESGEVHWWEGFGLRFVSTEVRLDAAPLKGEDPFPVVIFSPGNGTNIEFYSVLASEIASHGYIVIGLNHPYDVAAVQLSNGEVAPYDKAQWLLSPEDHQAYVAERMKVRTADVLYVFAQLHELSSRGPFVGRMDLDSVAVAGHSLGGIAASEACKADRRFKGCVNFDGIQRGGPFSLEETAVAPEQPFLFLTKEAQLHPKLLERFESMTESYRVVVHGASHESFTDGPLLRPSLLPGPGQADRWMSIIQNYSLAFLDHTLKGQAMDLLSESTATGEFSVDAFPSN